MLNVRDAADRKTDNSTLNLLSQSPPPKRQLQRMRFEVPRRRPALLRHLTAYKSPPCTA